MTVSKEIWLSSAVFTTLFLEIWKFGCQNMMMIIIIVIHGKSQDQYFKNQGCTKMMVIQTLQARHKMFPYVLECYGAGKSVTPNNDCKTLTIFCFRGKISKPVKTSRFVIFVQQSNSQKILDLLVFIADPPFVLIPSNGLG